MSRAGWRSGVVTRGLPGPAEADPESRKPASRVNHARRGKRRVFMRWPCSVHYPMIYGFQMDMRFHLECHGDLIMTTGPRLVDSVSPGHGYSIRWAPRR